MIFNSCHRRGKEARHGLFKWSKTTIPRVRNSKASAMKEQARMRGARRRNRARRRLKSLRFILFNVGAALSFVPRINSNQLAAQPSLFSTAKA